MNRRQSFPKKLLLVLLAITCALVCLHLFMQYLNLSYDEKHGQIFEISNRVDVDDEASIPTWFSQVVLLGVGASAFIAARLSDTQRLRRLWYLVATVGVALSLDEVAALHELAVQSLHLIFFGITPSTIYTNAWVLVLPVVVLVGSVVLWWMYRLFPLKVWGLIVAGFASFILGAGVMDVLGNGVPHNTFFYQGIMTGVEEALEMLGGILILYAIVSYLFMVHPSKIQTAWQQLNHTRER